MLGNQEQIETLEKTSFPGKAGQRQLVDYLNLKLAANGLPTFGSLEDSPLFQIGEALLSSVREKNRVLASHLCAADQYINDFLRDYLADVDSNERWLPAPALNLERHGLARVLSIPPDRDFFSSDIVKSYRVHQGVLHNPDKDRRTTAGVFHVCEGGLPIPADKKSVPKNTFANILKHALKPPRELMRLPFTSSQEEQAETFVSLMLRPVVCPEVPGFTSEKRCEVRFFVPGNLVSNLDFVESIFGNAGDPFLSDNDARLDIDHWSGHTGCVILAPHLIRLTKKELGLPHVNDATELQKRDGMCWENEGELYNDGTAFKVVCRGHRGVAVTVIADNYFGYCKKEVKSNISYAANLMGLCEEEHGGGALAFPRFDLGENFEPSNFRKNEPHSFAEMTELLGDKIDVKPEGYAVDAKFTDIIYIPEHSHIQLRRQSIRWQANGQEQTLKLQPEVTYVLPSGYRIEMVRPDQRQRWRLVGTNPEGTLCHKPCTVSGGGKSEISKPIEDAIINGPIVTADFKNDFARVVEITQKSFDGRHKNPYQPVQPSRPLLSPERSLGSVVRLLTPSEEYTDMYNEWLRSIPRTIRDMVLVVKRFYRPDWGDDWMSRFSVDSVNGQQGFELKYRKERLRSTYLRVGFEEDGSWRTFALRKDFFPAEKIQVEDDITASVVVPAKRLKHLHPRLKQDSYKFVMNCEHRLFQRPDEAIVRGYDKTTERDFSSTGNFFANYEPLSLETAKAMVEDTILFGHFSEPIKNSINEFVESGADFCVATSHPRIVNGEPSKNPRYLQDRPDLENPRSIYLAELGARLSRRVPPSDSVLFPVNSVLPGRRNNPADHKAGIRPLAVYNPIHFQEWPELFMEFIASLTGKSPSTTGAGSEGALTKGPFNSLPPIIDLNNALVSYLLTNNRCFTTSAGFIGPKYRFDHDISLLIPEVWSRMFINEREPEFLIENGYLEKLEDFEHNGKPVLASRLGYRITDRFVNQFFGRVFSDSSNVFTEEMLKPELQSMEDYVDGIDNIVSTQNRIAKLYLEDGSIEMAIPPLKVLLTIMAEGSHEGRDVHHPEVRAMFDREAMIHSQWYRERLVARQQVDRIQTTRQIDYLQRKLEQLDQWSDDNNNANELEATIASLKEKLVSIDSQAYLDSLVNTLGTDPAVLEPVEAELMS